MDPTPLRVANPPARPLMIWDGDCGFCGAWIRRWQGYTDGAVDYETYQSVGGRFPEINASDYAREIYFIFPDGRVVRGAEAVFESLNTAPRHGLGLKLYHKMPGFKPASQWFYRGVAQNRFILSRLTKLFIGDPGVPSTYRFSGMLFLRLLGLVFLIAFLSFWVQAAGLVGDHGIIPVNQYFDAVKNTPNVTGMDRFWQMPSLLWFFPDSFGLNWLCGVGSVCALLVMAGLVPGWALLGCVLTYASLRNGVYMFLNFQWDALLVETGFVALLVAPWGLWERPWAPREPSRVGRWSLWWLMFKLMVMSGLVKVLTNDPGPAPEHPGLMQRLASSLTGVPIGENRWLDGTALQYHYFTQPIPSSTSWWFHQLPAGFQTTSLWTCMFIEIIVPFAFFGPRRLRHLAALLQIFLQFMFLVSGNYGFFNLLSLVLCLPLLDDTFWPERVRQFFVHKKTSPNEAASRIADGLTWAGAILRAVVAGFVLLVGLVGFGEMWAQRSQAKPPAPHELSHAEVLVGRMQQLGLVNAYGLFRVMTTDRPELIIEGSRDGKEWLPYEFIWKPGDPGREPSFTTPHMPRLDWQMWFAALEIYYDKKIPQWLPLFIAQLKAGNPDVLKLLDNNPFAGEPPQQIRVKVYLYHFATPAQQEKTDAWWSRTLVM